MLPTAVIDNTLLTRLQLLGVADKLPFVFRQIRIPGEVRAEAYKGPNKRQLRNLLNSAGKFFVKCLEADVGNTEILKTIPGIDAGEAAAISQAEFTRSALISDDYQAYRQALVREVEVYRTGRILCLLKEAGQLGSRRESNLVAPYLERLINNRFRLSIAAIEEILNEAGEKEFVEHLIQLTVSAQSNERR